MHLQLICVSFAVLIADARGQQSDFDGKSCGRQLVSSEGLIESDSQARAGQWPWHAALFHRNIKSDSFDFLCGGTLVHTNLVVTAAHCVMLSSSKNFMDPGDLLVKVGRYNTAEEHEEQGQDHEVCKIVKQRSYNPLTHENDIVLLKLKLQVTFTQYVQPACLWKRDDGITLPKFHGQHGTVLGWELMSENRTSLMLNMAQMQIVSIQQCLKSDRDYFSQLINSKPFCAGGTDVWNGGSGGGMFIEYHGQWYLRGVLPFRNTAEFIGFTDAGLYVDWIYVNAPVNKNITDPILGHPNIRLINQGECGKNEYIFGYQEDRKSMIKQYLWMVALRHPFQNQEYVPCNGVLINKNYILTTNCVDWNDDVAVTLGDYITGKVRDCEARQGNEYFCTSPTQITYVSDYVQKDELILARLSSPAYIGRRDHIQAICLPTSPEQRERVYQNYILTGWKESGNDSQYLQRAIVGLIPQKTCRDEMAKYEYASASERNVTDSVICVRNVADPNWSPRCEDYQPGTAIQAIEKRCNRYHLYGIQTGISYCSKPERFIAVSKYMMWILDNIQP